MARQGCSDASAMAQVADSGPIPRSSGPRSGVQGAHSGVSQARGRRSAVVLLEAAGFADVRQLHEDEQMDGLVEGFRPRR